MDTKDTVFSKKRTFNFKGRLIIIDKPLVMGVLNVTPDSFYHESRANSEDIILKKVSKMIEEGVDIIDIGGYSSRPGAEDIEINEELNRLSLGLNVIKKNFPNVILSVDTFRSTVAKKVVENFEVDIINDISGGNLDDKMHEIIADLHVTYVLMHMKGTPQNMKDLSTYDDVNKEITLYFAKKINHLHDLGIKDIIIDPGFGFAKNIAQNFHLLKHLEIFKIFELPILAGLSRKSFIYKSLNIEPHEAINGTTALNTLAILNGADILRVHDVKEAKEVLKLLEKYKG